MCIYLLWIFGFICSVRLNKQIILPSEGRIRSLGFGKMGIGDTCIFDKSIILRDLKCGFFFFFLRR